MSIMDQDFQEILTQRDAVLSEREDDLKSKIAALNEVLDKVVKERSQIQFALSHARDVFQQEVRPGHAIRLTIKEAVMHTLACYDRPMGALEILEKLKEDFGMVYERTSLSPQLSRLKAEEKISLDRGTWSIKKQSPGT